MILAMEMVAEHTVARTGTDVRSLWWPESCSQGSQQSLPPDDFRQQNAVTESLWCQTMVFAQGLMDIPEPRKVWEWEKTMGGFLLGEHYSWVMDRGTRGSGLELRTPGKSPAQVWVIRARQKHEQGLGVWSSTAGGSRQEGPVHSDLRLCIFLPRSLHIPELFLFLFLWGACGFIPATHSITPAKH